MLVEFFEGSNPKALQDKINTWFKSHPNIATHLVVQSQESGKPGKTPDILISLWYSEIPPPPPGGGQRPRPSLFRPGLGPLGRG